MFYFYYLDFLLPVRSRESILCSASLGRKGFFLIPRDSEIPPPFASRGQNFVFICFTPWELWILHLSPRESFKLFEEVNSERSSAFSYPSPHLHVTCVPTQDPGEKKIILVILFNKNAYKNPGVNNNEPSHLLRLMHCCHKRGGFLIDFISSKPSPIAPVLFDPRFLQ